MWPYRETPEKENEKWKDRIVSDIEKESEKLWKMKSVLVTPTVIWFWEQSLFRMYMGKD